ncbi:hypothetical protein EB796_017603 [Bugula neritina]|uniref:Uncharacterized protein n=1 Tax=Bugula neritina TaxID=10212 RepID=A0A7J7JFE7_BUGNE|nr:hypothetical protein EB796_017603 [Bugula neritina]
MAIALCAAILLAVDFSDAMRAAVHPKIPVCEENLFNEFCKFRQLVKTRHPDKCLRARALLQRAISDCEVKDPVKRVFQGSRYVKLFVRNCGDIEFPSEGCGKITTCLQTIFKLNGRRIDCSKREEAENCYHEATKGECALAEGAQRLVIHQTVPRVCPSGGYNSVRPLLPSCRRHSRVH